VARRAPGIAPDPDQMGTPFLRASNVVDVPDPLRYQLRTLMGLVGGRYVLVPAGLVFRRQPIGRSAFRPSSAPSLIRSHRFSHRQDRLAHHRAG